MHPDQLPLPDDQDPAAARTAGPDRAVRGRAVIDFRPYPTATTRTRRSPANPARRPTRRDHPPTPSTVWFTPSPTWHEAAPDDSATASTVDGTSARRTGPPGPRRTEPAETVWPIPVLARAVTSFSEPGASVLLLPWPSDAREGRTVPAALVAAVTDLDRRPVLEGHRGPTGPSGSGRRQPDGANDRVDLLITSMPAHHATAGHTDTVARLAAGALRLGGILVVLTHCDRSGGVLVDPTGPMVTAGQSADLLYLQHIVAVHLPPADLRAQPGGRARGDADLLAPASHRRVHSDVLVFAQPHDDRTRPAAARPARP